MLNISLVEMANFIITVMKLTFFLYILKLSNVFEVLERNMFSSSFNLINNTAPPQKAQ